MSLAVPCHWLPDARFNMVAKHLCGAVGPYVSKLVARLYPGDRVEFACRHNPGFSLRYDFRSGAVSGELPHGLLPKIVRGRFVARHVGPRTLRFDHTASSVFFLEYTYPDSIPLDGSEPAMEPDPFWQALRFSR